MLFSTFLELIKKVFATVMDMVFLAHIGAANDMIKHIGFTAVRDSPSQCDHAVLFQ